jgi:alcohol dehydrogenase YqhD (iron-dependent ADH family)
METILIWIGQKQSWTNNAKNSIIHLDNFNKWTSHRMEHVIKEI